MSEKIGNPVKRLFGSSKGLVVMLVTALSFAALFTGKSTFAEVESLLKYVLGPWLAAVGLEDAARHVGTGLASRGANAGASIPPPAQAPAGEPATPAKKEKVVLGADASRETVRAMLEKIAEDDTHVVLYVTGASGDKEVAAFVHSAKEIETTERSVLEAAEEEAEEHPGEIRRFRLTHDNSGANRDFWMGVA